MSYDFEINMFSHIPAKIVEHMIVKMVEEKTGKKVNTIVAKYTDSTLMGYDINFVSEKSNKHSNKPYVIDNSFKPLVIE